MDKIDIVLQGGIWGNTYTTACKYLELPFTNNVIISTWGYEAAKVKGNDFSGRVKLVLSEPPEHDGGGNLNYQIISSAAGLKECVTNTVIKARSDQTIKTEDMLKLHRFYEKFHTGHQIYVLGMGTHYPYHPQDHVFWGRRGDVVDLFDLPLEDASNTYGASPDFNRTCLRAPIYLGGCYYARFSETAQKHIADRQTYLMDTAPKRDEAFMEYKKLKDTCFIAFPRIEMDWHKYNRGYMYEFYAAQGEVYHDEVWE